MNKVNLRSVVSTLTRFGLALASVGISFALSMVMHHYHLVHPFTSFSMVAIAVTFWYGGAGPGLFALLLSFYVTRRYFIPPLVLGHSISESYLIIYAVFGILVSWFSASRRHAERSLTEARDTLDVRVKRRTAELEESYHQLERAQSELSCEKDRLKLLLELTNTIASNLELR